MFCAEKFLSSPPTKIFWIRHWPEPPAAGDQWGSGGEAPSRRRLGGLEAEPPVPENFAFFCKNSLILGLF